MAKKRDNVELNPLKNFMLLPLSKLVKADWNYKEENDVLKEKLKANIKRNGQIENLIVRELKTGFFEIVNGNHRYDALKELETDQVVCYNCGVISDAAAQRIAIETNETKFSSDNIKLAELIKEIQTEFPAEELAETMPYTQDELENFGKLLDFDWSQYDKTGGEGNLNSDLTQSITVVFGIEDEQIKHEITDLCSKYKTARIK